MVVSWNKEFEVGEGLVYLVLPRLNSAVLLASRMARCGGSGNGIFQTWFLCFPNTTEPFHYISIRRGGREAGLGVVME